MNINHPEDQAWEEALGIQDNRQREAKFSELLDAGKVPENDLDVVARQELDELFGAIGLAAEIDFSVYDENWDSE